MVEIRIDNNPIHVAEGTSVLEAARLAGANIPTMCYLKGQANHPSCMVCVVKDRLSGNLFPSCAMPVMTGMDIITSDTDITHMRRHSLELLLSDHLGDCDAPCQVSCPANMNIPLMNRLIANNQFNEALKVVKTDIALPHILGYVCPAPCENACRRKQIDGAVSVCLLKRATAAYGHNTFEPPVHNGKKVAIAGAGVAGLSLAYFLQGLGFTCHIFEKNPHVGGPLRYLIPPETLPPHIIDLDANLIIEMGAKIYCNTPFTPDLYHNQIKNKYDALVLAMGEQSIDLSWLVAANTNGTITNENSFLTSTPSVYAIGSMVKTHKMAIRTTAHAKKLASILAGLPGQQKLFNSRFQKLNPPEFSEYLKESVPYNRNQSLTHLQGFDTTQAVAEAKRCLHCDCRKKDACKLRDYSTLYQANQKACIVGERNHITKYFGPSVVVYEPEKCIRCGLCVDIATAEISAPGLTFIGRGFNVRVQAPFNENFDNALKTTAIKCIDACPTGALAKK
jgi:ferredoxin